MPRTRSETKRRAILTAATEVVAEAGVAATTARIARTAGLAEGTLFLYFADKAALLNELYLELKREARNANVGRTPASGALIERARAMWNGSVAWAVAHPTKRRALRQLAVSGRITPHVQQICRAMFAELDVMLEEALAVGPLRGLPPAFGVAIMSALIDAAIEFIAREPRRAEVYRRAGFDAFWSALGGELPSRPAAKPSRPAAKPSRPAAKPSRPAAKPSRPRAGSARGIPSSPRPRGRGKPAAANR